MSEHRVAGKTELAVMGESVTLDRAQLVIGDIDQEMDSVAAQMSYFGELWAQAEQEDIAADAHYRAWRAAKGEELLQANEKLAEWKVAQAIESSPKFATIKDRLALGRRNVIALRAHYEAFRTKASILQSKGAMKRAEFEATGMSTRREGRAGALEAARDDRTATVRATFKGKRGE